MAIIDIDRMCWEMENTMQSNFTGTPESRFKQARKQFIEAVEDCIDQNKEDLIRALKEELEQ